MPIADTNVILVNVIAVFAVIIPGYFAYRHQNDKVGEIHVLVNSRLTETQDKVKELQREVEKLGGPKAPKSED